MDRDIWIEVDEKTQERIEEVRTLYETGFHIEGKVVLKERRREYEEKYRGLLRLYENGELDSWGYGRLVLRLMDRYIDVIHQ